MEKGYHINMLSITIMAAANQTRARRFYPLDINAQTKNESGFYTSVFVFEINDLNGPTT